MTAGRLTVLRSFFDSDAFNILQSLGRTLPENTIRPLCTLATGYFSSPVTASLCIADQLNRLLWSGVRSVRDPPLSPRKRRETLLAARFTFACCEEDLSRPAFHPLTLEQELPPSPLAGRAGVG
jgi:hypothetical protein